MTHLKTSGRVSDGTSGRCASARRLAPARRRPLGFTLTEILIVIGLIVLMLALAVPAFNLISGGKSIETAANQLSAALGRARSQAIGLQKVTGVMFYKDTKTGRQTMAIVQETDAPAVLLAPQQPEVWLDQLDAEGLQMPVGVGIQLVLDGQYQLPLTTPPVRTSDGYMGYNADVQNAGTGLPGLPAEYPYGGVILFDGNGRLVSLSYGFRGIASTGGWSPLAKLLYPQQSLPASGVGPFNMIPGPIAPAAPNTLPRSQFGLVMYTQETFANNAGTDADAKINSGSASVYTPTERAEETWLDNNATPFMVNRYNGTLIKGE